MIPSVNPLAAAGGRQPWEYVMPSFQLEPVSRERLSGVHPDLVRVIETAATLAPWQIRVTEGLRSAARQREMVAKGASQTQNSRHLTGHAVDLAVMLDLDGDGRLEARWDWPLYRTLGAHVKAAALKLRVPLVWGGDWRTLKDGPHFELPRKQYPA